MALCGARAAYRRPKQGTECPASQSIPQRSASLRRVQPRARAQSLALQWPDAGALQLCWREIDDRPETRPD